MCELATCFLVLEKLLQSDWVPALVLAANAEMPNRNLDKSCALGEVSGVKCLCIQDSSDCCQ